jgi:hypothetical protein
MTNQSSKYKGENFSIIRDYFDALDESQSSVGGPYKRTELGQFVPSPIMHIKAALDYLLDRNLIDPFAPLLDAGSGDGRIIAIASLYYGITAIGVEYDAELFESSRNHINHLSTLCQSTASGTIIQGDFTDDLTYKMNGLTFQMFSTVFNYINNESSIAYKISQDSPPHTKFVLLGAFPIEEYNSLNLRQNLELIREKDEDDRILVVDRALSAETWIEPFGTYLQVYENSRSL